MKKSSLLLLLLLLPGCTSRSWTESTETTRPAGPAKETVQTRALADEFFELRTETESDGFSISESLTSDNEGRMQIELLAPALQCLGYAHDVTLELWSFEEEKVVYTRKITAENANEIVREYSVQARLGTEILLRKAQAGILDRVIEQTGDKPLRDQLEAIRANVKIRMEWE